MVFQKQPAHVSPNSITCHGPGSERSVWDTCGGTTFHFQPLSPARNFGELPGDAGA